jgi:hypothetical protein
MYIFRGTLQKRSSERCKRRPLQPVPGAIGKVQSAASAATTAAPDAISKVQSAASIAATTAVPNAKAIEALIPRNCSPGTKQFCAGFSYHTECNSSPLDISNTVPKPLASFVDNKLPLLGGRLVSFIVDQVQALQPLEGS